MSTAASNGDLAAVFQTKYAEFADDLASTFPELAAAIAAAKALGAEERVNRFRSDVLPAASPSRDPNANPGTVLPGVVITDALWSEIGDVSRGAIQEYLTLLSVCTLFNGVGGAEGFGKMFEGAGGAAFMDDFLNSWKGRMASVDFKSLSEKMAGIFGIGADGLPKLPEKFLKGHLARLAEELVRDFDMADFGLDPETVKACESDPSKAFQMLMQIYTTNPGIITGTIGKIGKRLQAKIQSGEIRPQEMVAEAEELMKSFSDNPAFVEMMETFRSMFGMEDMGMARQAGREGSARLAMVKERIRRKMEAKKATAATATQPEPTDAAIAAAARVAADLLAAENTIQRPSKTSGSKGGPKANKKH